MIQPSTDNFTAVAYLRATLNLGEVNERGFPEVTMTFGEQTLQVRVYSHLLSKLQANPPEGEQVLKVWPRVNRDGTLRFNPTLAAWRTIEDRDEVNTFYVLGRLGSVDRDNATVSIEILPNPKTNLIRPFYMNLVSSLELMDKLPPVGSGLKAWGEVKPRTQRFVMTKFQPVPLPPAGESIEQRKLRKKAATEAIAAATAAKQARLAQEVQAGGKAKTKGKPDR